SPRLVSEPSDRTHRTWGTQQPHSDTDHGITLLPHGYPKPATFRTKLSAEHVGREGRPCGRGRSAPILVFVHNLAVPHAGLRVPNEPRGHEIGDSTGKRCLTRLRRELASITAPADAFQINHGHRDA